MRCTGQCVAARIWRKVICGAAFVCASVAGAQDARPAARLLQPVDEADRVVLQGNTHPLASAANDRGAVDAGAPMQRMLLTLGHSDEQEAALKKLLDAQQDSTSASFHRWLTPVEFGQRFGAAEADVAKVVGWLKGQGFAVNHVGAGRTTIEFSGTAGQVAAAFRTEIHRFQVGGVMYQANVADPSVPAALSPVVRGVVSMHNFPRKPQHVLMGSFLRDAKTGQVRRAGDIANAGGTRAEGVRPLFNDGGNKAVAPYDFATIYNVKPLWDAGIDGTGQTIAIVAETNIHLDDARAFRAIFGLPQNDPQVILDGPDPGITAYDEGEADIDVQWSGAVARNATIKLVVAGSSDAGQGVDLSALYIVDNNVAPVMSESYGQCELSLGTGGNAFYNSLWQQAAAQGISVVLSSGDNGSAGCDAGAASHGLQVSGLASTPYDTAVGGTDFLGTFVAPSTYWSASNNATTQASALSYIPETTWNSNCTNPYLQVLNGTASTAASCQFYYNASASSLLGTVGGSGGASGCTSSNGYALQAAQAGTPSPPGKRGRACRRMDTATSPTCRCLRRADFWDRFTCSARKTSTVRAPVRSTGQVSGVGGTSVAAPAFAGILALVNQKTNARQGVANYVLYSLFNRQVTAGTACASGYNTGTSQLVTPASTCVFNDLTYGSNSSVCTQGTTNCPTSTNHYGILTTSGGQEGYVNTAGYDLAAGLGSVNAANLVNSWANVVFAPTTTTLSLASTTFAHGSNVNATIGVTAATGTPTGDVSVLASTPPNSVGDATLSAGSVTAGFNGWPGGTYTVSAHYAGDATFAPSDSTSLSVTVTPESSTLTNDLYLFDPTNGRISSASGTTQPYGANVLAGADACGSIRKRSAYGHRDDYGQRIGIYRECSGGGQRRGCGCPGACARARLAHLFRKLQRRCQLRSQQHDSQYNCDDYPGSKCRDAERDFLLHSGGRGGDVDSVREWRKLFERRKQRHGARRDRNVL